MEENIGLPSFGTKYGPRRAELRERIRNSTISVIQTTVEEEGHERGIARFACYFCQRPIVYHMYIIEEIKYVKGGTKESKSTTYIDDCCYHDAKRNQYIDDAAFCLN